MFKNKIARGMALLDAHVPGWASKIKLNKLEMSGCTHCVLGQLAGRTESDEPAQVTADRLGIGPVYLSNVRKFGFATDETDRMGLDARYRVLTDEWRAAIARKLAVQKEPNA